MATSAAADPDLPAEPAVPAGAYHHPHRLFTLCPASDRLPWHVGPHTVGGVLPPPHTGTRAAGYPAAGSTAGTPERHPDDEERRPPSGRYRAREAHGRGRRDRSLVFVRRHPGPLDLREDGRAEGVHAGAALRHALETTSLLGESLSRSAAARAARTCRCQRRGVQRERADVKVRGYAFPETSS